mmetsp:Transcript_627/g.1779  ORF Transcript_627/g.1779 Transcript_627/m.1779 type:complete len:227 (+) Transcript_627:411-1091(+)
MKAGGGDEEWDGVSEVLGVGEGVEGLEGLVLADVPPVDDEDVVALGHEDVVRELGRISLEERAPQRPRRRSTRVFVRKEGRGDAPAGAEAVLLGSDVDLRAVERGRRVRVVEEAAREEEEAAVVCDVEEGEPSSLELEPAAEVGRVKFRQKDAQGLLRQSAEAEAVGEVSEHGAPEEGPFALVRAHRRGDARSGRTEAVVEGPEDAVRHEVREGVGFVGEALEVAL